MEKTKDNNETEAQRLSKAIAEKYKERTGRSITEIDPSEEVYPLDAFDQEDILDVVCGFFAVEKGSDELRKILDHRINVAPQLTDKSHIGLRLVRLDSNKVKTVFAKEWCSCGMIYAIEYILVGPGNVLAPIPSIAGQHMSIDEYNAEYFLYAYPPKVETGEDRTRREEFYAQKAGWIKYAENLFKGLPYEDLDDGYAVDCGEEEKAEDIMHTAPQVPDDLTNKVDKEKAISSIKTSIYDSPYPGRDDWCERCWDDISSTVMGKARTYGPDGDLINLGIRIAGSGHLPFYVRIVEFTPSLSLDEVTYTLAASEAEVKWMKERNSDLEKLKGINPLVALQEGMKLKKMLSGILLKREQGSVDEKVPEWTGQPDVKANEEKPVDTVEDDSTNMECPSESAVFEATPENLKAFRDTIEEMYTLYEKKNSDYTANDELGSAFEFTYRLFGLTAPGVRLADKFIRYVALATGKKRMVGNESIEDTLIDMANYCVMTLMEIRKGRKEE